MLQVYRKDNNGRWRCAQALASAVRDREAELKERREELQVQLGSLLARHEQLARALPWHQQQVRVNHGIFYTQQLTGQSEARTEARTASETTS